MSCSSNMSNTKKLGLQKLPAESLHAKLLNDFSYKIVSRTQAALVSKRETSSVKTNEIKLLDNSTLVEPVKEILKGRNSQKSSKLRKHYIAFTDMKGAHYSKKGIVLDLKELNKFCQNHVINHIKGRGDIGSLPDITHLMHAEVPEIMLEMLNLACYHPEFFQDIPDASAIPYLAVEVIISFMMSTSATYMHFPDKFFADSAHKLEALCEIAQGKYLDWFNQLAVCHFFGVASSTGQGRYWLLSQPATIQAVLDNVSKCSLVIQTQISEGDVYEMKRKALCQLSIFQSGATAKDAARCFSYLVTSQCIYFFLNMVNYSRMRFERYTEFSAIVKNTSVLNDFKIVVKFIMRGPDPTHLLLPYLNAVSLCLEMKDAMQNLLIKDVKSCEELTTLTSVESFIFWKNDIDGAQTSNLAWIILHALSLNNRLGAGWCLVIIHWYLTMADSEALSCIIEAVGPELIDLAHLLDWFHPKRIRIQVTIMEALLKCAGFSYQKRITGEFTESTFVEDDPYLPEWGIEAAVFCKRARCEEKMNFSMKQSRVTNADKVKEVGNASFKSGDYYEAIGHYTEAIATCPLSARIRQAIYYSNRAECYLRIGDLKRCISDCNRALCLDRSLKVKVQWRRAKAYQKLDLKYPAWLDMRSIHGEIVDESAAEFESSLKTLEKDLNIFNYNIIAELDKQQWYNWLLADY